MTGPECPLCAGAGRRAFQVRGYSLHQCTRCASLFVAPVPADDALAAYYRSEAERLGSVTCWSSTARHVLPTWERALADVERLTGKGPLLDVGCGAGQFLGLAEARGFGPLFGLELVPEVARAVRSRVRATVLEEGLFDAPLDRGTFAAVTLWDVLEHLPRPVAALLRVREVLRPGGVVAIGVPSRSGATLRLLGRRSRAIAPPEHLFLPTARGLRAALAAADLEPVRVESEQIRIQDWVPAGVGAPAGSGASYRRLYGLLTGPAGLAAQRAANAVLDALGLGDQIVALARRAR